MEINEKMLQTKDLAFLDYFVFDEAENKEIRQFSVFDCKHRKADGTIYYRDLLSDVVYFLKDDNGERMQDAPVLVDNYNKIAKGYGGEDLLFKAESSGSIAGDFDCPSHEAYADRFQVLAKDMKFKESFKYGIVAGKLRKDEIGEKELVEMVKAINANERKLALSTKPRRSEYRSFKYLLGKNVTKMVNDMAEGLETLEERYSNDDNQMGE